MSPGYYHQFVLPEGTALPTPLVDLLQTLWRHRYDELYEPNGEQLLPLDAAIHQIIEKLVTYPGDGHRRLVVMALALARATRPTILSYMPDASRLDTVERCIERWLHGQPQTPIGADALFNDIFSIGYPQSLGEGLLVYYTLCHMIEHDQARGALATILDTVLQGYAIIPGSAGRRDIFNWIVLEVIPVAFIYRLPARIYTKDWPWPPHLC
jgi:hypothetical protein